MSKWRRRHNLIVPLAIAVAVGVIAVTALVLSNRGSSSSPPSDAVEVVQGAAATGDRVRLTPPVVAASVGSSTQPACPWLNPVLPVASRVDLLLHAMTPLQEATLLHLDQENPSVGYEGFTPAIPQLCFPMITEQDGAAGVATGFTGVTQLPAPVADAASFDPALAQRYGDVIGSEDAAKGVDLALSPTINIERSPLWGRAYESLGEDPFLTASMAVPLVKGIQANRVVSVVKHFAVYNQEMHRATGLDNAIVTQRALHEIYLPAFSAAVQQGGAGAVMCSYNLINGIPACENSNLLDGILRDQWHFSGFVRSDCGSVYAQQPAMAVGVSQVKCSMFYNPEGLAAAVTDGHLPRASLDALARPLLTVLFRYNLVGSPHPPARYVIATSQDHQQVALQTDDEGAVLLRNVGGLLPLDLAHLPSLALIGPSDATPMPAGFGAIYVLPSHPITNLAALRAAMGRRLRYNSGTNIASAVSVARHSTVVVIVLHDVEAERHDRTTLALPGDQDALVSAVAAANPRTIVVL